MNRRTEHPAPQFRQKLERRGCRGQLLMLMGGVLALTAAGPTWAQEDFGPAEVALEQLRDGSFRKAAKTCRRVLKSTEESPRVRQACLFVSAAACNGRSDFRGAEDAARQLLDQAPAADLRAAGEKELALALVGQAKGIVESRWSHSRKKAMDLLTESEGLFRGLLEQDPKRSPDLLFQLANSLQAQLRLTLDIEREPEIHALLSEFLRKRPDGPGSSWARQATCATARYAVLDPYRRSPAADDSERPPYVQDFEQEAAAGRFIQPQNVRATPPTYSPEARKAGIEGVIAVRARLGVDGKLHDLEPLERLPFCLTEEAMLAFIEWVFEPATLDGEPIDITYHVTINFRQITRGTIPGSP